MGRHKLVQLIDAQLKGAIDFIKQDKQREESEIIPIAFDIVDYIARSESNDIDLDSRRKLEVAVSAVRSTDHALFHVEELTRRYYNGVVTCDRCYSSIKDLDFEVEGCDIICRECLKKKEPE